VADTRVHTDRHEYLSQATSITPLARPRAHFCEEQNGRIWIIPSTGARAAFLECINQPGLSAVDSSQGLFLSACYPPVIDKWTFYVDYPRQTDGAVVVSPPFFTAFDHFERGGHNSEQSVNFVIPKSLTSQWWPARLRPMGYLTLRGPMVVQRAHPQPFGQEILALSGQTASD